MPASARDGEDVCVRIDITEDFERGVMLEQKIHVYAYTANVLEHVGKLHVSGV